ncbi:Fur-regulated basic protein FbpA [Thermaerobacillus caldiproteolyticus]|uniref:Fur-regulated basic protein FbpA n=1 Tax=Thermaerobacillus caldiproteolyticus TaxID=247480 RepID=UPI001E4AFB80|nr:Fur-regulated basic protein FbpA [Anoxybacillus caldiproteolyticus]
MKALNNQPGTLRKAVERKRQRLIKKLIKAGVHKMQDGRQLYELTLTELQQEINDLERDGGD